jgi:predicted metalloendopeptidase
MRSPYSLLTIPALALSLAAACADEPPPPPVAPVAPAAPPAPPPPPTITLEQAGINTTWMDPAANPCSDFFLYACGGFLKTTVIPADRPTWGATEAIDKSNEEFLRDVLEKAAAAAGGDAARQKIGDYYASCVDEDSIEKAGLTPIKPLLAVIAKVKDVPSLGAAVTALHGASIFPLFEVGSLQDYKDATQMIGGLDQGGLGLPDRDYYLKDEGNTAAIRTFYKGHVARMLGLVGLSPAEQTAGANDVLRIETAIAKLSQDKVDRRDPYKVYHRVDRAGLPGLAKSFPWDAYFAALGFPGMQAISVNEPSYFTGIDALMKKEKPAAWRHYLAWHLARGSAKHLTRAFVNESFALRHELTGQKEVEPRWKRCVRSVDSALGELLAQPYVEAKFPGNSKTEARALVSSIHDAMRADLTLLPWMDDATRSGALAKLDKLTFIKVGYPDKWRSYDFAIARGTYAANAMAADKFELHRQLAKVGLPVDRTDWGMSPPTVNAYYDPSMNEIVVPAGELQPPFFSRDFYPPVNIGDEGANTVGHEITHGFDDQGSQFDGAGNLRDWWTPATKAKFEEATQCVRDQYSQYEAVPGVKLNGPLTAGENIADIGGVKLGYQALQTWEKTHPEQRRTVPGFTDEKLFFLAYAQGWCTKETPEILETMAHTNEHSPARWRVNGPMADNATFAAAYACAAGTPLNTGKACSVW